MRKLVADIEINATPEEVWAVLTDFDSFPEWNPFLTRLQGRIEVGRRISAHMQPAGGRGMDMTPIVTSVDPGRQIRWFGSFIVRGLFDGDHTLRVEAMGDKTRFVQREIFTGVLVPFTRGLLARTQKSFEQMNEALKARVESKKAA